MTALPLVDTAANSERLALIPPATQLSRLHALAQPSFDERIAQTQMGELRAKNISVLQINVGKVCNQSCHHCHVDAGPDRTEVMSDDVVDACLSVLERENIPTLDITGGAPELHPRFEDIVRRARQMGRKVIDRCNLTILTTKKYRHLPRFFADHNVEVVCSLPDPQAAGTDAQRGDGVFTRSIEALKALNAMGYGQEGSDLELVLVTNPLGAALPAQQCAQEQRFRKTLQAEHGISFTRLSAFTNMPIARQLSWLDADGSLECYMKTLVSAFNDCAATGVMCRETLSVSWEGHLYDCDFNQMLELPVEGSARSIHNFDLNALGQRRIVTGPHCFACTAGQGSSCGGATA